MCQIVEEVIEDYHERWPSGSLPPTADRGLIHMKLDAAWKPQGRSATCHAAGGGSVGWHRRPSRPTCQWSRSVPRLGWVITLHWLLSLL